MNEYQKTKISKFLSLILRHKPETIGISLDEKGWIEIEILTKACAEKGVIFNRAELEKIVETNDKKRFSFNQGKTKIRANQGHSIDVKLELEERIPPKILYHGTAERNLDSILINGLQKMKRHHVHLSVDFETARNVGARYGRPAVFAINTEKMLTAGGFKFFVSANEVWLVDEVPPQFLKIL